MSPYLFTFGRVVVLSALALANRDLPAATSGGGVLTFEWVRMMRAPLQKSAGAGAFTVDSSRNIYVTGWFEDAATALDRYTQPHVLHFRRGKHLPLAG